jgi:Ku70/Ku80 beta-barrel domain
LGFLRLSLVTCPVALYPATAESEKISFNQLNKATGHRIKYLKVDADTGEEVPNEDIVKGYMLDKEIESLNPPSRYLTSSISATLVRLSTPRHFSLVI